jgi:hypothetical protein
MQANMASIQFVLSNQKYTMKAVFAELVRHKEYKKYKLLNHAVENDMNPGIKDLEDHNYNKSTEILTKSQYRASIIVRNMMAKRLYCYYRKWKEETDHYNTTMRDKVRIKLTQLLKNRYAAYFNLWKSNAGNKKNDQDSEMNQEAVHINEQLTIEAMANE